MRHSFLRNPYVLVVLTVLFWSGNWVLGRGFRGEVPPIALAFWRWVLAFICTLPFCWPHRREAWPLLQQHWRILCLLALFGITGYNTLAYFGLQYTTATNGVLLNSFIPIVIIVLSVLFLGKRLQATELLGVSISLSGVTVIVAHGEFARLMALSFNPGDLLIMLSVFVWAGYTLLLQHRAVKMPPMLMLAILVFLGILGLVPFYIWELAQGRHIHLSLLTLSGIAYTGIFPAFLGYVFWSRAVAALGSTQAGLFIHLMPVATPLLSALFLGETPQAYHFAGMVLILGGIVLSTRQSITIKLQRKAS